MPNTRPRMPNRQLYAEALHLIKADYDKEMARYKAKKAELEDEHELALADIEKRRDKALQYYLFPAGIFQLPCE